MNDKIAYTTPEVVALGSAEELIEGSGPPVQVEAPGSGTYYDPTGQGQPPPPPGSDDDGEGETDEDEEMEDSNRAIEDEPESKR